MSSTVRSQGKQKLCAYCDRTFTKVEHLKRHQRSHTGEKPFKCNKCGRRYARSDVLARHIQKHPFEANDQDAIPVTRNLDPEDGSPSPHRNQQRRGREVTTSSQEDVSTMPTVTGLLWQQNSSVQNHESFATLISSESAAFNDIGDDVDSNFRSYGGIATVSQAQSQISDNAAKQAPTATANAVGMDSHPRTRSQINSGRVGDKDSSNLYQLQSLASENPLMGRDYAPNDGAPNMRQQSIASFPAWRRAQPSLPAQQVTGKPRLPLTSSHDIAQQKSNAHPSNQIPEPIETQMNNCVPSSQLLDNEGHGNSQFDILRFGSDSNVFDLQYGTTSAGVEMEMSPNMMELMGITSPMVGFPPLETDNRPHRESGSRSPFSTGELKRINNKWPRHKTVSRVRLIRVLWHGIVQHEADNLFSDPLTFGAHSVSPQSRTRTSKWGMEERCRNRLMQDIRSMGRGRKSGEVDAQASPALSAPEVGFQPPSPENQLGECPSLETLQRSLDFFFRCSHPVMPFIHKATFDAETTPSSLLLPMCLIGLLVMEPRSSKPFIRQFLLKMIPACQADLTSKALNNCRPSQLILTLASALLVLYLALDFVNELDECQLLILCAQALRLAEKQGIFAAYQGTDLILDMLGGPPDSDGLWKSWARAESVKRIILYLIWIDSAYTCIMGTAGVLQIDKVEVILPCDAILFEAPTAANFLHATNAGTPMTMPRMHMDLAHGSLPAVLSDLSLQTLLDALHLQISAARHKLLVGNDSAFQAHSFVPAEIFAKDDSAKNIGTTLLYISANHHHMIQGKTPLTALTWHSLCMMLTADLDRFELASGREGGENTQMAMVDVVTWSKSAGARRAVIHAAQIFWMLSLSRIPEKILLMPEVLLFSSALVLGLYLFVTPFTEEYASAQPFEVLQEIDWAAVGSSGLLNSPDASMAYKCTHSSSQQLYSCCAAQQFIGHGGIIAFAGDILRGGAAATRKILLDYAHLIDEVTNWQGSEYSQLLRALTDSIEIEDDQML